MYSTEVEHSTKNLKIEGSNNATGRGKLEKNMFHHFWYTFLGNFPGPNNIKLFTPVFSNFLIELECHLQAIPPKPRGDRQKCASLG